MPTSLRPLYYLQPSVGATFAVARRFCTIPLEKPCHCEPVTDVTGVAIRIPHPLGPLA